MMAQLHLCQIWPACLPSWRQWGTAAEKASGNQEVGVGEHRAQLGGFTATGGGLQENGAGALLMGSKKGVLQQGEETAARWRGCRRWGGVLGACALQRARNRSGRQVIQEDVLGKRLSSLFSKFGHAGRVPKSLGLTGPGTPTRRRL
ncbi:hypothetical protein KIL84_012248 [Mauremys mutica]|uniref:Uncharacterized protein n=1 Tax=Mauremys mutica TaxID=74926 RepID=A0A9D4B316_9SAUR|nr:hypothetical protein KIL84_012248 [Mauremys mutica]